MGSCEYVDLMDGMYVRSILREMISEARGKFPFLTNRPLYPLMAPIIQIFERCHFMDDPFPKEKPRFVSCNIGTTAT